MHEIRDGTTKESPFRIDVDAFHGDKMPAPEREEGKKEKRKMLRLTSNRNDPLSSLLISASSLGYDRMASLFFTMATNRDKGKESLHSPQNSENLKMIQFYNFFLFTLSLSFESGESKRCSKRGFHPRRGGELAVEGGERAKHVLGPARWPLKICG